MKKHIITDIIITATIAIPIVAIILALYHKPKKQNTLYQSQQYDVHKYTNTEHNKEFLVFTKAGGIFVVEIQNIPSN